MKSKETIDTVDKCYFETSHFILQKGMSFANTSNFYTIKNKDLEDILIIKKSHINELENIVEMIREGVDD